MTERNIMIKVFWTIWAIGWYQPFPHSREWKIFIGPVVITWWR